MHHHQQQHPDHSVILATRDWDSAEPRLTSPYYYSSSVYAGLAHPPPSLPASPQQDHCCEGGSHQTVQVVRRGYFPPKSSLLDHNLAYIFWSLQNGQKLIIVCKSTINLKLMSHSMIHIITNSPGLGLERVTSWTSRFLIDSNPSQTFVSCFLLKQLFLV